MISSKTRSRKRGRRKRRRTLHKIYKNDSILPINSSRAFPWKKKGKSEKGEGIYLPGRDTSYGYSVYSRTMAVSIRILFREEKVRGGTMGRPFIQNRVAPSKRAPALHTKRLESHGYYLLEYVQTSFFLPPIIWKKQTKNDDLPFSLSSPIFHFIFLFHYLFLGREEERTLVVQFHRTDIDEAGGG